MLPSRVFFLAAHRTRPLKKTREKIREAALKKKRAYKRKDNNSFLFEAFALLFFQSTNKNYVFVKLLFLLVGTLGIRHEQMGIGCIFWVTMVSRLQKRSLKRKVRAAYNQAHTFLFKLRFCKRLHARKRKEALDCNPSPLRAKVTMHGRSP